MSGRNPVSSGLGRSIAVSQAHFGSCADGRRSLRLTTRITHVADSMIGSSLCPMVMQNTLLA